MKSCAPDTLLSYYGIDIASMLELHYQLTSMTRCSQNSKISKVSKRFIHSPNDSYHSFCCSDCKEMEREQTQHPFGIVFVWFYLYIWEHQSGLSILTLLIHMRCSIVLREFCNSAHYFRDLRFTMILTV